MIKLGNLEIKGAVLAPMAGFTDSAFRLVCKEMGAGLTISEMISAKALCYGDKKTASLISFRSEERPFALQIFGNEPQSMAHAAEMLLKFSPDIIDINMGCPVPKIAGNGCGSALLKTPGLAGSIVSEVCRSVNVPVSVKFRIGWDSDSLCTADFAAMLEQSGASLITVHGRTRAQMYSPGVNLDEIAAAKARVNIPVIANGDITDGKCARRVYEYTGCDGVMIGRAALGNPFVFREIAENAQCHIPKKPSSDEKAKLLRRLCALECENKGERLAMLELRRHLPFFFKGMRNAAEIRKKCCSVTKASELEELISLFADLMPGEEKNEV